MRRTWERNWALCIWAGSGMCTLKDWVVKVASRLMNIGTDWRYIHSDVCEIGVRAMFTWKEAMNGYSLFSAVPPCTQIGNLASGKYSNSTATQAAPSQRNPPSRPQHKPSQATKPLRPPPSNPIPPPHPISPPPPPHHLTAKPHTQSQPARPSATP